MILRAALAALALAGAARAAEPPGERVIARLDHTRIAITARFSGAEIFVYGAVARDRPPGPDDGETGVVVRLAGPSAPLVVRRKARVLGVWANAAFETIDEAPAYYAVASTGALHETISYTEDLRHRISLDHALRIVGARTGDPGAFIDAAVRLKRRAGLYVIEPGGVEMVESTLFSARFSLPSNLVEGVYRARIILTRDRDVVDVYEAEIDVAKAGLERLIFEASRETPLLYGLAAIAVALLAGLAASEGFRLMRR